ncbi:hypothetical protein U1Q18_039429 [Sarracenia purpurea var. burkii]
MSSPYPALDDRPIDQWKVTELKEELKRRKLMANGLKEDLIKRLDEAIRNENEFAGNVDNCLVDTRTSQPMVESEGARTFLVVSETTEDMMDHGNNRNEVDHGINQTHVDYTPLPLDGVKVQEAEVTSGTDHGNNRNEVDDGINRTHVDDSPVSLEKGKVQEMEVTKITDSCRDDEIVVHAPMKTSIMVKESVVSEIAVNVIELRNNDSQNKREDLKSQMENEEIKLPHEDVGSNSSDPNNQVSEVLNTVLGLQVKSDSISIDCVSIDEKNELKDNIIADNIKLEVDVNPEMVHPSSASNVLPDSDRLRPVDVEEPRGNEVSVEERDGNKATNVEMSKKIDTADVVSSEKLNLDRSSGDDSMEDEASECKQIDSKYNLDKEWDKSEKTEFCMVEEEPLIDIMHNDISVDKKEIHDENKNSAVAPPVKRKLDGKLAQLL